MQNSLFEEYTDLSGKKVLIGLSGGINSMAALCVLAAFPEQYKPKELHLFYAHFVEHSPGTDRFVIDGIRYAKKHFQNVHWQVTFNSVLLYFEEQKMIPHPSISPCSRELKIEPINRYMEEHDIDFDLVGYVREEKRRITRQLKKGVKNKLYLIAEMSNEECFTLVKREIGWYPEIYDKRNEQGQRIFKHNNCLPCKNMYPKDLVQIEKHYPAYALAANDMACGIGAYWGRDSSMNHCRICED